MLAPSAAVPSVVDRTPLAGDHTRVPFVVGVGHRWLLEVAVVLPLEPLLGSIAGRGRGPCMLLSHRDKSTFHSGCRRTLLGGWGDNSIVLVRARGWVRQG